MCQYRLLDGMIALPKTMAPSRSPTFASVGSDGNGTDAPNVADPVRARVMYAARPPLAASAVQEVMGVPAWKSRPCWFLGERMVTVAGV